MESTVLTTAELNRRFNKSAACNLIELLIEQGWYLPDLDADQDVTTPHYLPEKYGDLSIGMIQDEVWQVFDDRALSERLAAAGIRYDNFTKTLRTPGGLVMLTRKPVESSPGNNETDNRDMQLTNNTDGAPIPDPEELDEEIATAMEYDDQCRQIAQFIFKMIQRHAVASKHCRSETLGRYGDPMNDSRLPPNRPFGNVLHLNDTVLASTLEEFSQYEDYAFFLLELDIFIAKANGPDTPYTAVYDDHNGQVVSCAFVSATSHIYPLDSI